MKKFLIATAALALSTGMAVAGMIKIESPHSVAQTVDRLEAAVGNAGAKVFARIDHQKGASSIGAEMPGATMLMFGNPKLGTPLMQSGVTAGLDLPLRVLAYEDGGKTWLTYHDPVDLAAAHGLPADHPVLAKMAGALRKLTGAAVSE